MKKFTIVSAIGVVGVSLLVSSAILQAQHRQDSQQRGERAQQRGHQMGGADGQTPPDSGIFRPDELEWRPGPASLAEGAEYVVLEGDPSRPAPFTMRLKVPDGFEIRPHWHPVTERITVIQGTFHLGMGEEFDRERAERMPEGTFAFMPPGMRHFAFAEGETIVQLNGIGPWDIIYLDEDDDPRRR